MVNTFSTKYAVFSPCGNFRYALLRTWDASKPILLFIMLNPSTADATSDDPTIRKCTGFAQRMGFGGITVVNLFAFRATDPSDLARAGFPVGAENDGAIRKALSVHSDVVLAWGAHARKAPQRAKEVEALVAASNCRVRVLARLADGVPAHPLMLPYSLVAA